MRAIVLAAGVGWRLRPHTDATPKCLLELGGKSLLQRYLEALAAVNVSEAVFVVGYMKEPILAAVAGGPAAVRVRCIENKHYRRGNILSLWHAREEFDEDVLIMDSDLLFPHELLARLVACADKNAIALDERFTDTGEQPKVVCEDGWVVEVTKKIGADPRVRGEAVGILRLSAEAAEVLRGILEEFVDTGKDSVDYEDTVRELADEVPIGIVEVGDLPWVEIDFPDDLARARDAVLPKVERLDSGQVLPAL